MRALLTLLFFSIIIVLFPSCSKETGIPNFEADTARLIEIINLEQTSPRDQLAAFDQLVQELHKNNQFEQIQKLASRIISEQPHNIYNAYYLAVIGECLQQQGAPEAATLYYHRAVYRYPDIETGGNSVHYRCLQNLLEITDAVEKRLQYYQTLQDRFAGRIDPGLHHYRMAKTYEAIGSYEAAFEEYEQFVNYPATIIPGKPDAYQNVRHMLAFRDSDKDWTRRNLDDLVRDIQYSLSTRNPWRLRQNRADVNFFAMSWKQDQSDPNTRVDFPFDSFLSRNRIRYANELEPESNANEAYLWTSGWEPRISTWYLYFRKIKFPSDPDINGNWEWAGIYFGEQL